MRTKNIFLMGYLELFVLRVCLNGPYWERGA